MNKWDISKPASFAIEQWKPVNGGAESAESGGASVALGFEVAFGFDGGHAAGSGGGDGLAIGAVLDVTGVEDAFDVGAGAAVGDDVAVRVKVNLTDEGGGIGDVADGDKEAVNVAVVGLAGDDILEAHAGDDALFDVVDVFDDGIGEEFDFGVIARAFEHDFGCAELLAAVDEGDFGTEAGEEVGFFHGGVAAADDHDLFVAIEEAVARGAGTDAVADQLLFVGQTEPARGGTGGDDERAGFVPVAIDEQTEGMLAEFGFDDGAVEVFGAEAFGLFLHILDEFGSIDAFGEAGKILDKSGERKLSAGLVAHDDEGLQVGARGVDGGSVSGATGTDDDDVSHEFKYMLTSRWAWCNSQ
jgi:hypothetical protein